MSSPLCCPLCEGNHSTLFHQDDNKRSKRAYYQCLQCRLVFVPPEFYLSESEEKAEYDRHNNDVTDDGYRVFLDRLWCELKPLLPVGACVLDFGCGPGPLLAKMMQEDGFAVSVFDHFYANHSARLTPNTYDALTSTEVIEHLHHPKQVFAQWLEMVKAGGYLGVMTKLVRSQEAFASWHYKNDLTHVCFFSRESFQWLADQYGLSVTFHGQDVMIMKSLGYSKGSS